MKKLVLIISGLFLMTLSLSSVSAQNNPTASDNASASATIIQPISIEKVEGKDLLFGNIIASSTGGTVQISTDGTPTLTGVSAPSIQGERQAAEFNVTGMAGTTYAITLPESIVISSGANQMTVDNFVSNPDGTGILNQGSQILKVGATLNVNASQATGTYNGSFNVTVVYN